MSILIKPFSDFPQYYFCCLALSYTWTELRNFGYNSILIAGQVTTSTVQAHPQSRSTHIICSYTDVLSSVYLSSPVLSSLISPPPIMHLGALFSSDSTHTTPGSLNGFSTSWASSGQDYTFYHISAPFQVYANIIFLAWSTPTHHTGWLSSCF